jgi:hypothetical protein
MTNWKTLQDTNPEPSLLDAIAHAEKKQPKTPRLGQKLKDAATYIATFGQGQ